MEMNVSPVVRSVPSNAMFGSASSSAVLYQHNVDSRRTISDATSNSRLDWRTSPVDVTPTTATADGGHGRAATVTTSWYDDKVLSTTTTVSGRELDSTANRRYSSNGLNTDARRQTCAACGGDIVDRFLLHAVDRYWHIHCLRCSACQAVLADLGSTCFTRAGMTLCRNDYIR